MKEEIHPLVTQDTESWKNYWGEQERLVQSELKENTKESADTPVACEQLRRYRREWKCSLTLKGGRIPIG